ncbi:hypothetical protein B0T14DRAFT_561767 [Immersiella caudata]|uniref:Uncharacterized protein n=1 Tax=Immersiella caudata TaxID=314043 RepID=A0AA39X1X9_9PEZI|nr:hypothetical protein B0T14DRAFT_561767 [Immersiella caudata]
MGYYSEKMTVMKGDDGLVGKAPNAPFAILFTGRKFSEEKLIACAYAFEQATRKAAEAPSRLVMRPSTDLTPSIAQEDSRT